MNIVVVGMGYVGLIAACCLAKSGYDVTAVETNIKRLEMLKVGKLPFYELDLDDIFKNDLIKNNLKFTTNISDALVDAQVVIIAVGTPSLPDGRVDLSQVYKVAQKIMDNVRKELIVIMKSTVPPGTGNALCMHYFKKSNVPIAYVSNPEFLREGKSIWDWYHPDRIIIGCEDVIKAKQVADIYSDINSPVVLMDVTSAEMVKYASNAFLATKISFVNEIANLCELVGANIDKVAPAIGMDTRIGHHFLQPGLGYGGSCFPKDTKGLDYISSFNGYRFSLLKAVIEVNARQRIYAVTKLNKFLGDLKGKQITVLGLAFKPGTDDIREAPALDIINYLADEGALVKAVDPMALNNSRAYMPESVRLFSDPYEALNKAEAVLLATEWPVFIDLNWIEVKKIMQEPFLIIDGRNALDSDNLLSLGFQYYGFGRISVI